MKQLIEIMEKVLVEQWKDLPGWQKIYQVSNNRRIRRIGGATRGGNIHKTKPSLLKPVNSYLTKGLIYYKLRAGQFQAEFSAETFYNAAFKDGPIRYKTFDELFKDKKKENLLFKINELNERLTKASINEAIKILREINALRFKLKAAKQDLKKCIGYGLNFKKIE